MSGKKVFTHAGELLAQQLIDKRDADLKQAEENKVLDYLGIQKVQNHLDVDVNDFEKLYQADFERTFSEIDTTIFKRFKNYTISDGTKELPTNEVVQRLYHAVKNLQASSQAQFKAIGKFTSTKIAETVKKNGELHRQFSYELSQNSTILGNLTNKALDYFTGGENDQKRIYYKFSGNRLLVNEAKNQNWVEVFRVSSLTENGQAIAGTDLMIGGTAADKLKTISLLKPTNVKGDLTVTEGEIRGIATSARFADLAEYYTSTKKYTAGDLVAVATEPSKIDSGSYDPELPDPSGEIQIYNFESEFIGVVSEKPGFVLNKPFQLTPDNKLNAKLWSVPVVLTGRSPVKLINKASRGDSIYVPIKSNFQRFTLKEKEFYTGKAIAFSKGAYNDYISAGNTPLRKIGTVLYDAVKDQEIYEPTYDSNIFSYKAICKIN